MFAERCPTVTMRDFQFLCCGVALGWPSVALAVYDSVSTHCLGQQASQEANVFVVGVGRHIWSDNEDVAGSLKVSDYAFGEKGSGMV